MEGKTNILAFHPLQIELVALSWFFCIKLISNPRFLRINSTSVSIVGFSFSGSFRLMRLFAKAQRSFKVRLFSGFLRSASN